MSWNKMSDERQALARTSWAEKKIKRGRKRNIMFAECHPFKFWSKCMNEVPELPETKTNWHEED